MLNQVDILSKKGVKCASLSGLSEEDNPGMSKTLCCRFLKLCFVYTARIDRFTVRIVENINIAIRYFDEYQFNKNKKWVPLRAMKTFIRKDMGHTT